MGMVHETTCNHCDLQFELAVGGSMLAEMFHCHQCDEATAVERDRLRDAHAEHANAIDATQCDKTRDSSIDSSMAQQQRAELAAAPGGFDERLQQLAGLCPCGGQFGLYAQPRCPACKSTNLSLGDVTMCFD
ncbi:MAG: hypothetical protein NXI04_09830 [Planctomycetaceae bacterium]|nr:hypothetical protein [Planctomycetaceae bacterium]